MQVEQMQSRNTVLVSVCYSHILTHVVVDEKCLHTLCGKQHEQYTEHEMCRSPEGRDILTHTKKCNLRSGW